MAKLIYPLEMHEEYACTVILDAARPGWSGHETMSGQSSRCWKRGNRGRHTTVWAAGLLWSQSREFFGTVLKGNRTASMAAAD
jgi:hypothetical protein